MDSLQEKSIRLFAYLRDLSNLRSVPERDIKNYDQFLWIEDIPKESGCRCIAWRMDQNNDEPTSADSWIEIKKPQLKSPPEIPDDLEPWIKTEDVYDSSLNEPELYNKISIITEPENENLETTTEVLSIGNRACPPFLSMCLFHIIAE